MLLQPLEGVKQSPKYHPEGDALYHSLQVFELARDERPYDEEFLLAALLHDVGKAIDPSRPRRRPLCRPSRARSPSGPRWLIDASHGGPGLPRRAPSAPGPHAAPADREEFDDLMLLRELDRRGRVRGALRVRAG